MLMLGQASPSTLDAYEEGVRELTVHFPHGWGTIALAEETMRAEQWDIMREQVVNNSPAAYSQEVPWDFVIGQSTYGVPGAMKAHWWESRVVLPLVKLSSRGASATAAAQLEGSLPVPVPDASWGQRAPRANRGRRQSQAGAAQQPTAASLDKVRGFEYCYAWNRGDGFCPEPCAQGRLHACEFCGKTGHRGSACWSGKGKAKGKGKGKGKKGQQPQR